MIIQAIPTIHKGTRFRSKLEAQWAFIFDRAGWRWDYEPVSLGHYIPDFFLHFEHTTLVEIKPAFSIGEIESLGEKARCSGYEGPIMILGASKSLSDEAGLPVVGIQWCDYGPDEAGWDYVCVFK